MPNLHRRTRRDKLFRRVASRDVNWVLHLFVRVKSTTFGLAPFT